MKKTNLLALLLMISIGFAKAQISGVFSVPGSYTSVAAAVNDLNTQGVNGPVTINIAAGYTETAPVGGYTLTVTGTAANPIIFQKSGVGTNPLLTANVGTAVPTSATQDGIWSMIGSDYITIDGIDLNDPNAANPATMEYGYGFFKTNVTDGCQNNIIKNCVITLNKINNALGSGPAVDGSRGINVVNAPYNAQTTALTITAASGANSNNKFYSNTIQNTNIGIAIIGFADITPFTNADFGNDVGGNSIATGNTIINFGGGAATSPAAGVRTLAQYNINVSFNTLNNNNGSGANHATTLRGIYLNTAVSANASINNNTLTLSAGAVGSQISVIENVSGATAASNAININNNLIANCNNTITTTGIFYGIWNNAASCASLSISNNTFTNNITKATSGTTYLIYNTGAATSAINITANNLSFNHTGATAHSGSIYSIYNTAAGTLCNLNVSNNTYNAYNHTVTGTGLVYFLYAGGSPANLTINSNTWNNLSYNYSGTHYFIYNAASSQSTALISNNNITNITRTAAAGSMYSYYGSNSALAISSMTITNNSVSNITATVSGTGAFYGFYCSEGASPYPKKYISNNTVSNVNMNATGIFYGLYANGLGEGGSGSGSLVYNNNINNITRSGTMYVLYISTASSPNFPSSVYSNTVNNIITNGATSAIYGGYIGSGSASAGLNFFQNKFYDITANGASGIVYGLYTIISSTTNIYNNLVGNLFAPIANGNDRVNGIYVNSGTNINLYYNSIYLSGTSSGANFGSNAIYASTTPNLLMKNNIFYNNCTPIGTGLTCAYKRSSTTLSTFLPASNNNLFYAGVPTASNIIFTDGTTPQQTLANYQTAVAPMDNLAVTENVNFATTVGSNPNFLNINTVNPTLIESGGTAIMNITGDYINTVRNASTPDIGAWEGNFTPSITCSGTPSAGISSISTPTGCPNLMLTLSNVGQSTGSGISYQWQSAPTASGPWTNIIGATGNSYNLTSPVNAFFQLVVTCANSALSATTAPVSYSVVNPGPCICNNYGLSNATNTADEEILNVTFGTLNSTSTCTTVAPGPGSMLNQYSNYSGFVTAPTVVQGQSVPFSFQVGTCGGNFSNSFAAYIDYNQNGLFTDPGEQVYVTTAVTSGPHIESGNITIPMTASVGTTRMRVINVETGVPSSINPTGTYSWGETEDYCVDIIASNACSGTPTTGVAAINTPTGCPSVVLSLNASSVTVAGGITYQWQSAPSASGPWTNIIGATNTNFTTTAASTTYYQMVTTCSVSSLSNTTSIVSYSVVNPGPCVCNGYLASAATNTIDEEMYNVTIGTLNSTSSCTTIAPGPGSIQNRYSNYTGFLAAPVILQGQPTAFTLQVGTCGGNYNNSCAIYIDYNQNGSFADPGEQAYLSSAVTNGPHFETGNITIPFTSSVGVTRMRVIVNETTPASILPNGTYSWGETEDYCIDIQPPPMCSGTPLSGTASINTPTGCPSVTLNLTATGLTSALGITYQWQSAPSASGPWTNIIGATNTTYSTTVAATTYFQLVTTCSVSALSATTSIVSYSVINPGPCVCAGYGSSAASSTADEEILNVTFGSLNSTSSCTTVAPGLGSIQNRYSNYSGVTAAPVVLQGQSVPFSFQIGTCGGNYNNAIAAFIDYNQNGAFTDPGEQVYVSSASTNGPHIETGNILVPMTASVGITRMRVISVETSAPASILPTGVYTWGETEDYCIDIQVPQPCTGSPASGTAAIGTPTGCISDPIFLTANGVTNALGINYQWQWAPSPTGPWTNIPSATNVTYSTTSSSIIFFQMVTTCTNSSMSATTSIVSYTPSNCYTMSNSTITTCSGTLYDSGGSTGNYQNNENYTLTIIPSSPTSSMTLSFVNFNLENNFDYLYIYDGNSTASPLIGQYTGATLPPTAVATNTAGILTLKFTSDGSVTYAGFQAVLSCTSICNGPVAAPTVTGNMVICSGNSTTLTATATGTAQWYATATATTPIATGTLFTTPILTNNTTYYVRDSAFCGTSTLTVVNITVNPLPSLPAVSGASICSGNSTTLTATSSGTVQWYTTSTPTAPIASGTLFTTPVLNSNTTYYVRDTTACGVSSLVPVTVSVSTTPTLSVSSTNTAVCIGNSATLTASSMNSYTWSTASNNSVIVVSPTVNTTYTVTGYSSLCNVTQTASINVGANPSPTVTLTAGGISTICAMNGSISLVGSPSGGVYSGIGVTNNLLSIANPGIFTPMYSYTNAATGCSNTAVTSVTVVLCGGGTGIVTRSAGINFNVMPNPNSGIFNIETGTSDMKSIELSDVTGRVVYSNNSDLSVIQVNINELANGVYYLKVSSAQGTNIVKVIKQ